MKLYSLKQIAETYGISVAMLKKLIANKQLTRVKVGNKNFISQDIIEAYILSNTIKVEDIKWHLDAKNTWIKL